MDLLPHKIHLKSVSRFEDKTPFPLYVHFYTLCQERMKAKSRHFVSLIVNKKIHKCQQPVFKYSFMFTCSSWIWMSSFEDLATELKHVFTEIRSAFRMFLCIDNRLSSVCEYAAAICGKMNDKTETDIKIIATGFPHCSPSCAPQDSCAQHARSWDLCARSAVPNNRSNRRGTNRSH